jgi:hypothetical protein
LYAEGGTKVGTVLISNDDNNLYVETDGFSGYKITTLAININADGADGITTQGDGVFYSNAGGGVRPKIEEYGVTAGSTLIRRAMDKNSWVVAIPVTDISALKESCALRVSVYADLEKRGTSYEAYASDSTKDIVNPGTGEWYSSTVFLPCGWDCPEASPVD